MRVLIFDFFEYEGFCIILNNFIIFLYYIYCGVRVVCFIMVDREYIIGCKIIKNLIMF